MGCFLSYIIILLS